MFDLTTAVTAIIASLIGGSLGAYITARLQITHEREQHLREAADDFARGALQAQMAARDGAVPPDGEDFAKHAKAAVPEVRRRVDEAHARLARVKLLFGHETSVGKAAEEAVNALTAVKRRYCDRELVTRCRSCNSRRGNSGSPLVKKNR